MKKIYYISTILLCVFLQTANAQMGVNSTGAVPNSSAMLDVSSTTKGFLMPRMTTVQRNAIASPANGLMVYDTDVNEIFTYNFGWGRATSRNAPLTLYAPSIPSGTNAIVGIGPSAVSSAAGIRGEAQGLGQVSGVYGISTNVGITGNTYGVRGHNSTLNSFGYGVYGTHAGTGVAIVGESVSGDGIIGYANKINPTVNTSGVIGRNQSNNGIGYGVQGVHVGSGAGVSGVSSFGDGIIAETGATFVSGKAAVQAIGGNARGVRASSTTTAIEGFGDATGVWGMSIAGTGTYGATNSFRGVWGRGLTTGDGVYGDASTGKGVYGKSTSSGLGVLGESVSGVGGYFTSNSGDAGYFQSTSGKGLTATSSSGSAIYADNTSAIAPVAQFVNLSGGTALSVIAQTALDIAGGIRVSGAASTKAAFKITTSASNTSGNVLTIPNTTLANNSTDILLVTHAFGTYLNKPFGVYWTGASWGIYVEDSTAMPIGTIFNVLVIKQ
ncbi:hypothetical protein VB796_22365 [Arcicella sp. LKC2W]|uniref:DUF7452 domain-containing protein n=1 Tax=Arcicella sp. LKC2W TaxID=2984198 RepID=UPI002B21E406|nr:hypothetical protein [Arcicella sp. LKC2W]MEA5461831.1 hypothetical protein [Arcicella sp. LKC2W]